MRAYRVAEKAGTVRAPREFVEMLRRETGYDTLDCWWDPECPTVVDNPRGGDGYGAWVVWNRIREMQNIDLGGGIYVGIIHHVYVDIFKLDGEYGLPLDLGYWVAQALNASDITKRGNHDRHKRLADARERAMLEDEKWGQRFARDFSRDSFVKRRFGKLQEEIGSAVTTREERIANEAELWRRQEAHYKRVEARAKQLRMGA